MLSLGTIRRNIQEEQRYKRWHVTNLPKRDDIVPLTEAEKAEVDRIWRPYQYKQRQSYVWHELYKTVRGTFEPEMVPGEAFYLNILRRINAQEFAKAWNDKAYAPRIFEGLSTADTRVSCIHGQFYDANYEWISPETAARTIQNACPEIIVKPTIESGQGKGVVRIPTGEINAEQMQKLAKERNGNCIFQLPIVQSPLLAALNESSVNVMRVNTVRASGQIYPLNATIRFGIPGMVTDVGRDKDGNEVLNLLGVDKDGRIMDSVFSITGHTTPVEKYGVAAGAKLEGYEEAMLLCREAHKRMHHFHMVGFDIAIDEKGKPLLIEANVQYPGIFSYQYAHGPMFGEHLQEVLSYCRER